MRAMKAGRQMRMSVTAKAIGLVFWWGGVALAQLPTHAPASIQTGAPAQNMPTGPLAQSGGASASQGQVPSTGGALPLDPGLAQVGGTQAAGTQATSGQASDSQTGPVITLDEALTRARANEPLFAAAVALNKTAALDRSIARAALLPSVVYHNQFLYTQGARLYRNSSVTVGNPVTPGAQTFIANNGIHEYVSQASINETLGLAQYDALARASANAAIANAELEIRRRGLTAVVLNLFFSSTNSRNRVAIEERALGEAASFVTQAQQREIAREVAHADVIKAQLTLQQRQRDLADAVLQVDRARLDLGVLLFPDPRTPYRVGLPTLTPLPSQAVFVAAGNTNNPELRSALATLRARSLDTSIATAAYLPSLALNYSYGIDAAQFAVKGRETRPGLKDNLDNLGYSASATLDIPVFDWFATPNRIRQTRVLRDAAKVTLSAAQRTLIAQLEEFYAEATLASTQLQSLQVSVDTARESLRLTRMRYSAGEATVLEVVDAQNSLTAAELAQTDGTVRYQLALANLQLLTGTI